MYIVKIMNEYCHGPIWVYDEKRSLVHYSLINDDACLQELNEEGRELYDSYLDFSTGEFSYEKERENKDKMFSIIQRIHKRLNEINDGSFMVIDCETKHIEKKDDTRCIVRIKNEYCHDLICVCNERGDLVHYSLIDGDVCLQKLNRKWEKLYDSFFDFDTSEFSYEKERANKDKMLSIIQRIHKRLDKINDGSFIVKDYVTEYLEKRDDIRCIVKIMLDYCHGPIWVYDEKRSLAEYSLINDDACLQELNEEGRELYDSFFNFHTCEFSDEKEKANKDKMLSIIQRIHKRLNEINDGSFIVEDYVTEYYENLK